jgi:hypothetical protein
MGALQYSTTGFEPNQQDAVSVRNINMWDFVRGVISINLLVIAPCVNGTFFLLNFFSRFLNIPILQCWVECQVLD